MAVAAEYGEGGHSASAQRLVPNVVELFESPQLALSGLTTIGRQVASEGHTLADANRWVELITNEAADALRVVLSSRPAAVAIAQGWTDATLRRRDGIDSAVTPVPALLHLLRREYVRVDAAPAPGAEVGVLIVVDSSRAVTDRLDGQRLRTSLLRHMRAVLGEHQLIAEGTNGNLVALADRTSELPTKVAAIDERILNDPALQTHIIRVWIEPLAMDGIHLDSHLSDLVGTPLE